MHRRARRVLIASAMIAAAMWNPPTASAAIALVQKGTLATGSGTSVTATFPASTAAGDLLVATLEDTNSNCSNDTVTAPAGWVRASHVCRGTSGPLELWYDADSAAGVTSVVFNTGSAGANMVVQLSEWSGVDTTSPLDQSATNSSGSSSTSLTVTTAGTINTSNELAITAFDTSAGLSSYTPGAGWTSIRSSPGNGFDSDYDLNPTTGATLTETVTSNPQTSWAAAIATFLPACTGGSLTVKASPTAAFPSVTLNAYDASSTLSVALTLDDESGNGIGWHLTGTSTTLSATGGKTLPTTATTITGASASAATGNCSLPTNSITYPVTLPAGATAPTAVSLYNAAANTGEGPTTVTLTAKIAVPASAKAGAYSSTWTLTLASGP